MYSVMFCIVSGFSSYCVLPANGLVSNKTESKWVLWKWEDFGGIKSYLPTPPLGQDMTQGQFFNRFEFRVFLLLD